jgi:hypothetical protein
MTMSEEPMSEEDAREAIQAVAEADYNGDEPHVTRAQAESILQAASAPGYSSIDNVRGAVEVLGMSIAAQVYIDELTACHRAEYDEDDDDDDDDDDAADDAAKDD